MIHLQIRAKSGLHAGAFWRIDQSLVTLGAHPQSDVFLCDPDIPDNLVTLRKVGRRYEIEGISPDAKLSSPDLKKIDSTLFPSQMVTLDFRHIQLELEISNASYGLASSMRDSMSRRMYNILQFLRGLGARAIVAFLFIVSLFITGTILFFGTAGVVKSQASIQQKGNPQSLSGRQDTPKLQGLELQMARNVVDEFNQFAARIGSKTVSVTHQGKQVRIEAELSRMQALEFEKVLAQTTRDYGDRLEIQARLSLNKEQQILDAIEVEQLILGSKPVLVLRGGERLFIGADFNGLRLVDIQSDKAVFQGNGEYEVIL